MKLDIYPYYTTTKNKNIADLCKEEAPIQGNLFELTEENKVTSPYEQPIESHRGGSLFNAHSYPTKIDYRSIMKYILYHTKPGDVVLDPFSGSGTTGIAAIQCGRMEEEVFKQYKEQRISFEVGGRKAILVDISQIATFISSGILVKCDKDEFISYANDMLDSIEKELGWMYEVQNENGEPEFIRQVIWSEVFKCPICGNQASYWESGVDVENKQFKDQLVCPKCQATFSKSVENKVFENKYDEIINEEIECVKRVPVRIYVQRGNEKYYRKCMPSDLALINKIDDYQIKTLEFIPKVRMMFKEGNWGEMYRSGYHKGITHVHQFYTKRSLIILSALWEKALQSPERIRNKLLFLISSYSSSNATLMTRAVFKKSCPDLVMTGAQNGQLYIGSISVEKNIIKGIREVKLQTLLKAFNDIDWGSDEIRISTQSNTELDIPNNSVDYIFTDPPFGQDIIYSEMNFISEAWLNNFTNNKDEIIICKSHGKSIAEYEELLTKSFKEMYRVLKYNKSASIVFHNSKKDVWNATLRALYASGFKVMDTSILDKKQGSIKQVKSLNSVSKDIVIHVMKTQYIEETSYSDFDIWDTIDDFMKKEGAISKNRHYLYSYYISMLIKHCKEIEYDSKEFYKIISERYHI